METYKIILHRFITFLKAPYVGNKTLFHDFNKVQVFITALVTTFVLNFGFTILFTIIETMGLVNFEDHASTKLFEDYPPYAIAIIGVILAPLLEELFFRGPLTLFHNNKWFIYVFYVFAIGFGLIHISNFEITRNVIILAPILVAPQIVVGLFLGVIRLQYGLVYSILFHALYNAVLIIPALLFMNEP
ncbi:CPBP family intramembrane glutamic endopeptidase [Formosa haliotis]|uniref:CPBP family intramembrane glutamic endopeptidase n=1 Tax=Formosa haliotis TaxID=1555194 RepID=UPI0008267B6E|nr:CPBP family intramembrane glutamic endopeptidase [Formosa haliotis]